MIKIIIIVNQNEDSPFFRGLMKREIERTGLFKLIAITDDLDKGLDVAECTCPDLLIWSPPGQDKKYIEQVEAIVRYREVCLNGGLGDVLILSANISEYAAKRLSEADVMYEFLKPVDPCGLAEKLKRIYASPSCRERQDLGKGAFIDTVKELLVRFGIYPSYTGYKYMVDAVTAMKYSSGTVQLTKDLYPSIGKKYGKSGLAVERAIRIVSGVASSSNEWKSRFPHMDKKMTNLEFISLLTEYADTG